MRPVGMIKVVMTLLCLTQFISISEANVPEAAVSAAADIIPREVHEALQATSDLLQNPEKSVDAFVEGLSASPNAARRAAKANKQIMSADDAISALAKRTKKELKGDLSPKSVASLKPNLHRSRAAKKAAKKIAARTVGQEAKREEKKHGGQKQKKVLRMAILVGQRKKALRKAKAALMLATKRSKASSKKKARKKAKKKAKANKKPRHTADAHKHLSHSKKSLFHPMSHSKAQCHRSCSSSSMKEVRHTCKKQCDKADYNCVQQCALPIKKCLCKCSSNKLWTCTGPRCGCWKLQHSDNGHIAKAMMKAENEALAKGLGKAMALKKAAAAEHTAREHSAKAVKHSKAAKKSVSQTKEWLKTVF